MSEPVATQPLKGLRVLVTRPAHQAENPCRLIEAQGGVPIRLPLLSIEPAAQAAALLRQLDAARHWDGWLFTSANAVRHAIALDRGPWPAFLAAVGAATAAALEAGGHEVRAAPVEGASAEALLALPEFQDVAGKRFLVLTGAGGLPQLQDTLRARGAQVDVAEVYRRVPLPYEAAALEEALARAQVIVLTSGEALAQLHRLTPEAARKKLLSRQLVLPSRRVVETALELGFTRPPRVAEPMSDAAILRCLGEDPSS